MAKSINIIIFQYFSIPQMTQKRIESNDIQNICTVWEGGWEQTQNFDNH